MGAVDVLAPAGIAGTLGVSSGVMKAAANPATSRSDEIEASIDAGKSIFLDPGVYRLSRLLSKANLAKGGRLSIVGMYGSELTRIIADTSGELAMLIGASERVGPLSISWPTSNGSTFAAENPDASITATAAPGARSIVVSNAAQIAVGDIIRIKCQRLDVRGETRNSNMCGETNEVVGVSGTTISLAYPLADSYSPDAVWTGTASAGTDSTVTLATGLAEGSLVGCRLTITGGTGADQVRYITAYDPVTGIATIDTTSSGYAQAVFSPVADATSTIVVDRMPYVFVTKAMAALTLRGFTLECPPEVLRGISIQGVLRPYVEDLKVIGARRYAAAFTNCIRPRIKGFSAIDANDGSLGYTIIASGCRDGYASDLYSQNCRRGGVDSGGSTPTWGFLIEGVRTVGGAADADAVPWGASNQSYGIGEHGQARDFTYSDAESEGIIVHAVSRGHNTKFIDTSSKGQVQRHFWLNSGDGLTIDGYRSNGRGGDAPGGEGHFLYITGSKWRGDVDVRNINCQDFKGDGVYVLANSGKPITERVDGRLRMRDYHFGWDTSGTVGLINGSSPFAVNGWEFDAPSYSMRGGGTFNPIRQMASTASGAGRNVYYRIGDAWTAAIADDTVLALPIGARNTQIGIELFQTNSASVTRGNGVLRKDSTTFSTLGVTTAIAALATAPTGTSGTDGNVSLHLGNVLTIENRIGSELQASLLVKGF